jgi:CBS domain-containing protein
MRAKDLMTTSMVVVRPDTSAKEAAALLTTHGFTLLPVVERPTTSSASSRRPT